MAMVEAAQAVRRDDAVAGDDDGQRVVAQRLADGAGAATKAAGELAIGDGVAGGDVQQGLPDAAAERRADEFER